MTHWLQFMPLRAGEFDILENTHEKVTIIAVGPLTNLAVLLRVYPHLASKVEQIAIMGGGIKGGNISATGEFNFYVDPHAAHVVINFYLS